MRNTFRIALLCLMVSSAALANDELLHFAAHFGMSYVITIMTYGALKSESKTVALVGGIAASLLVGFTYKYVETVKCQKVGGTSCWSQVGGNTSMFRNALGTAAAVGSIIVFKF